MTTSSDTPKHKTTDRMAERAERWAQAVADARAAEAQRVAAVAAERDSQGGSMREAVRKIQREAEQGQDGQR